MLMSGDFESFEWYLSNVLDLVWIQPDYLGIAIAGPINGSKVENFMNIKWRGFDMN